MPGAGGCRRRRRVAAIAEVWRRLPPWRASAAGGRGSGAAGAPPRRRRLSPRLASACALVPAEAHSAIVCPVRGCLSRRPPCRPQGIVLGACDAPLRATPAWVRERAATAACRPLPAVPMVLR